MENEIVMYNEEISRLQECLEGLKPGTEEYKAVLDQLKVLGDLQISTEKIILSNQVENDRREDEYQLKLKELDINKSNNDESIAASRLSSIEELEAKREEIQAEKIKTYASIGLGVASILFNVCLAVAIRDIEKDGYLNTKMFSLINNKTPRV